MNNNLLIAVGKRIRQVREALALTQTDFVKPLDRKASFLSQIENGTKTNPGVMIFFNISLVYHVRMDYLLYGTGDMFFGAKPNLEENTRGYIEDIESIDDMLWLFERSKFFKDSIMGYAGKFKYENEEIIKKSIERYIQKTKQEVKNGWEKNKPDQGNNKNHQP